MRLARRWGGRTGQAPPLHFPAAGILGLGTEEHPALSPLVARPGNPPLPEAAGHDLPHPLLPPLSPPNPFSQSHQEGPQQLIPKSQNTFPVGVGKSTGIQLGDPLYRPGERHCSCPICPQKPPSHQGDGGQGASRKGGRARCPELGKGLAFVF